MLPVINDKQEFLIKGGNYNFDHCPLKSYWLLQAHIIICMRLIMMWRRLIFFNKLQRNYMNLYQNIILIYSFQEYKSYDYVFSFFQ